MSELSYRKRDEVIQQLQNTEFDLVIIGGGITGAGLAVQAAASGLKTALIEMQDFSQGTSSRSTKLVHGGLRYLKQFDVEVVSETVKERAVVQHLAPHIPKADPMLLPIYDESAASFSMLELEIAMNLYDRLAGIEGTEMANQILTKEEVLERQPNLEAENLIGGGFYLDYRNNDARLVIENLKQAHADGAVLLSRAEAIGFQYNSDNMITGLKVKDQLSGTEFNVGAKTVVNAGGPWSDEVRSLDEKVELIRQMRPTKGVHLVVDGEKLPVKTPVYLDSGEDDGRMIFILPRENKTYFGTTDTDYDGDLANPQVSHNDVDYLLRIVNRRFTEANLTISDIEASWAGLRPLIAGNAGSDYNGGSKKSLSDEDFNQLVNLFSDFLEERVSRAEVEDGLRDMDAKISKTANAPSDISRGSDLSRSESGLITIAGGKLTDYRIMAQGALEAVIKDLSAVGLAYKPINSADYQISGGHFDSEKLEEALSDFADEYISSGFSTEDSAYLAALYGSNCPVVLDYLDSAKVYAEKFSLPLKDALSLLYALANEGVYTAEDYFLRRTNYMLFMRDQMEEITEPVLEIIAEVLDLSDDEKEKQTQALFESMREHALADFKED